MLSLEMIFGAELGNALILREYYFFCMKGWASEAYTNPAAVLSYSNSGLKYA